MTQDPGPLVDAIEPLIPGLRRFAAGMVRDRHAADDLVQDCLERVVSGWDRQRADTAIRAWVFAILRNLALNHLRTLRNRGRLVPVEELDALPTVFEGEPLERRDILRALDALPEEQKSVLLLVCVEECSYAEVARILDIPIGTVMSRLSRGRDRLRRLMRMQDDSAPTASIRRIK